MLAARFGASAPGAADALWQYGQIDVPSGSDIVRLRIGALDFAPAAETRYRYRMDGFDDGWIDNGPQPDITYTRLPPGACHPDHQGVASGRRRDISCLYT